MQQNVENDDSVQTRVCLQFDQEGEGKVFGGNSRGATAKTALSYTEHFLCVPSLCGHSRYSREKTPWRNNRLVCNVRQGIVRGCKACSMVLARGGWKRKKKEKKRRKATDLTRRCEPPSPPTTYIYDFISTKNGSCKPGSSSRRTEVNGAR